MEAYEEKVDQAIADRIEASDRADDVQPRPMPQNREEKREPASERQTIEDYVPSVAPSSRQEMRPGAGTERDSVPTSQEADPDQEDEESDHEMDTDMGIVGEDESEEEHAGMLYEDTEDAISSILLAQLGQSGRSYRREIAKGYRHLVSEIYSPLG